MRRQIGIDFARCGCATRCLCRCYSTRPLICVPPRFLRVPVFAPGSESRIRLLMRVEECNGRGCYLHGCAVCCARCRGRRVKCRRVQPAGPAGRGELRGPVGIPADPLVGLLLRRGGDSSLVVTIYWQKGVITKELSIYAFVTRR